jgi:hypothetical protein
MLIRLLFGVETDENGALEVFVSFLDSLLCRPRLGRFLFVLLGTSLDKTQKD